MEIGYRQTAVEQTVTSTIVPFEETYLSPALQGRIRSVKVEVNDHVTKGQLLVEMDRTQLEQTRLQYNTLKTDLDRLDTLLQSGSVTQQAYDQMKTQVESTGMVLKNLEENTLLKAPYSGIITGKYYSDGELFSPTPNTAAGKAALVSLIQVDPVKVLVNLSERYLPDVKEGMEAIVRTDVYPSTTFPGKVFRIHPTVNSATRTFAAEVRIPNRDEKLRPGMFARVSLKLGEKEAMIVPSIAVLQQSGTNERYIMLNENGTARRVTVRILNRYDDQLEIASPELKGGEQLIFAGQGDLEDGDPVNVVTE
jgi:RND family efflux transporter MFP subunit